MVVIPDFGAGLDTLDRSIETLDRWGVGYLIDPVIEPIGFGFMASLERYAEVHRRYPDAGQMMGVGNITELTSADTTGVNAVLLAIAEELGVRAVLTTEVIPWARGAVREIDIARRLMHYAVRERRLPKGVDDRLVTVKDPAILTYSEAELRELHAAVKDPNFRIFADREAITVFNNELFVRGTDIQEIFARLGVEEPTHAFYLGKELMKAKLAVQLGKTYRQEGALNWGYLTPPDDPRAEHVKLTQRSRRRSARAEAECARRRRWSSGSSRARPGRCVRAVRRPAASRFCSTAPADHERTGRYSFLMADPYRVVRTKGDGASLAARPRRARAVRVAARAGPAAVPGRRGRVHRLRLGRHARAAPGPALRRPGTARRRCSACTTG